VEISTSAGAWVATTCILETLRLLLESEGDGSAREAGVVGAREAKRMLLPLRMSEFEE